MFKLLNKIAWMLSIIFGFIIIFLFGIMIDEMDGQYSSFLDDGAFFAWIIGSILIGMVVKKIFLSKYFITSRLEFFVTSIQGRLNQNYGTQKSTQKEMTEEVKDISQPLTQTVETKQTPILLEDQKHGDIQDKQIPQPENPSKVMLYIKNFFAENLLAKIGSILVFLGVVFLMSLIWNQIPNVGKIIIGFAIGFTTYATGVILDKKGLSGEARTLLGTGILINFLVILAGKHLIGDNYSDSGILSTGMTFLFLILNTVFGVVTSMVYKSRTILLFSFIFAYINPFLTGGSADNPYTLVGYSMIISLGALFIGTKQNDNILKYSAFILGNILFLVAPFSTEIGWITKLIASAILGFLTIFNFSQTSKENIPKIFIMNYIFIIGLLIAGGDNGILEVGTSFISYMLSILFFFAIGIWLFLKESLKSIGVLFVFPILIVLGLIFSGSVGFITPALAIVVVAYLIGFNFLESILGPTVKYIFFGILGIFIFMVNSFLSFNFVSLDFASFITVIIISFIFLFTSYYLSRKNSLEFLYSIGTLGGILTLAPVLILASDYSFPLDGKGMEMTQTIQTMELFSILAIIIFALAHWFLPFINKNLIQKGSYIKNLVVGSIFGVLFIGFQLFRYATEYFPGVTMGISFGVLAIVYFILSYIMLDKIGVENVKSEASSKNTILSYLFISISLFSLAIALVFANNPEVVSTVWLFEATILFYFYNRTSEPKIFGLGIILFIIGILQLFDLNVAKKEFLFLIPFSIIFASLVYNLKFLDSIKTGAGRVFHDIFHILGIGILANLLIDIIPSTGHGWSTIGISLFVLVLGLIYSQFYSKTLKIFYIIVVALMMFGQYEDLSRILYKIDKDEVSYLRILQYATFGILTAAVVIWNKFNTTKYYNRFINGSFVVYTLFIISSFVLDIFNTTFAVTIFWAIVSSMLLFYGISADKIKLRTIGLYLLSLVLAKIFIYDIWYGLDDAVTRVVALIVIGVLLIVISTRYTRKYGNNLKGEFNFSNLVDKNTENESKDDIPQNGDNLEIPKYNIVNSQIQDVDISNIDSVKFYPNGEQPFSSKAKNLKKIVKLILQNNSSANFEPGELLEKYNYIIENYQSDLTKRDFDMLNGVIKNFIDTGGKVEIK